MTILQQTLKRQMPLVSGQVDFIALHCLEKLSELPPPQLFASVLKLNARPTHSNCVSLAVPSLLGTTNLAKETAVAKTPYSTDVTPERFLIREWPSKKRLLDILLMKLVGRGMPFRL